MKHQGRAFRIMSVGYLLIADIVWGLGFVAQKQAGAVPAATMAMWRSAFAFVFLLITVVLVDCFGHTGRRLFCMPRSGKHLLDITRAELFGGILCGLLLALATILQQAGLNAGTDGGKAAFITALYVVLVPVFAFLVFRCRSPLHVWMSVLVSIVGFFLLCVTDSFTISTSDLLVLACSVAFSFQILSIDAFASRCDGLRMSLVQFFTMFVVTLIVSLIVDPLPTPSLFVDHLPSVLYLGLGSSGVAYTCQILGQKGTPPAVASVILSLEAVVAAVGAAVILHESMQPREIIGCVVVLLSVVLSELDVRAMLSSLRRAKDTTTDAG